MKVRVLGAIEVIDPPEMVLGGPTQRRALAALVVNANRVVSVDQLIDVMWPDGQAPARAEHNMRTYLHRLRAALGHAGDRIETAAGGYRLRLGPDELDANRFEDLVATARTAAQHADFEHARELLDEALGLWGGRPYDEFADEAWAQAEVMRLSEVRAGAVERRFAALLDAGRHTEVVGPLQEAVATEPWREARRMQLAIALYRSGRHAEALQAIQRYKAQLADETGLVASPELERLEHQILDHDPVLLPPSYRGHMLRGYQLNEVMGEGAFSLVWRGVQPSLGRRVAIKQIRAELANQAEFVHRFETEAQVVAALEHPHIVPLYDYWREPDSAYLVMRYVAGGSLESELLDHRLDEAQLRRLVDQVGSALHTAHRAGVIHRDVKSANVLRDADGNFYLTDFGIAFTGSLADDELATSLSTGSPAYASPEQLRRQALDSRTDIYGFGITLFESATGRLPFADARTKAALLKRQLEDPVPAPSVVSPGVPTWVDRVVARATAKNPADRFASMAELMTAVLAETGGTADLNRSPGGVTVIGDLVNPFKALRAFREADAADFYGRDRLVARFLEVLARPGSAGRLLAVVGPSGSGKSSVVRSGLLPRLRDGALSGSHRWFITTMMPGTHPFDELESALSRIAVRQPGPLVELMRDDDRGIARAINQVLPDEDSELLLVIDQFEELFTHSDDVNRARFLDQLLDAVREPRTRLRVVLTVRADFWDRPLRHPALASKLETATVTVSPLAADELEAAIVEPVRRQGGVYEPGLVARIIADVGDQPGALPLLQYTLTELFDTNVSGLIRAGSYDTIGGLTGALGRRAEDTLAAMTADQQVVARRIFGALVTLGEGSEDTRRRVRITELGDDPDTTNVIEAFGAARLLVFDHHPATREPTVEIAHEALICAWPRLRTWLDEDRDELRIRRHLTDTAAAWMAAGRDPGELYRGGRLDAADSLLTADHVRLNPVESDFLRASVERHEAERASERARVHTLHRLLAITAVVAVLALIAGGVALGQRQRADEKASQAATNASLAHQSATEFAAAQREAESQRATSDLQRLQLAARALSESDSRLAMLLAVEAYRMEPSRASEQVLQYALTSPVILGGQVDTLSARVQLDDEQATLGQEPGARLHTSFAGDQSKLLTSVVTPDQPSVIVQHGDRWDATPASSLAGHNGIAHGAGRFTLLIDDQIVVLDDHENPIGRPVERPADLASFELSENGQVFVLERGNGRLDVYRATGDLIGKVRVPDTSSNTGSPRASLSADGSLLVVDVGVLGGSLAWDVWTTDPLEMVTTGDPNKFARPQFAGMTLYASAPFGNTVLPIDPFTLEPSGPLLRGHSSYVLEVAGNSAGPFVATRSLDGTIRVWDPATGEEMGRPIHDDGDHIKFAGNGTTLLIHHDDHVMLWNYDVSEWPDIACGWVYMNLTLHEWDQYGPRGVEWHETCEGVMVALGPAMPRT